MMREPVSQRKTSPVWRVGVEAFHAAVRTVRRAGRTLAGTEAWYRPEIRCSRIRLGDNGAHFSVNPACTPRSHAWLEAQQLPPRLLVYPFGIADFDGVASFDPPSRAEHVSYRLTSGPCEGRAQAPVYRVGTIMQIPGHLSVDLLKIDIEGGEYSVLDDMLNSHIAVRQICVEFHHRWPEIGARKTAATIAKLRAASYRIFDVLPSGEEFSFLLES